MNVIEIEDLVKVYPNGHRALDGLSLNVEKGSIFGFIGLNGAGKTTTIRTVAGLCEKDSGSVRLFGKDMDGDRSIMKRLGFVLDVPLYFDWMTTTEYLSFAGTMYGIPQSEAARRTSELIAFFDLEEKSDEPIQSLSTGMKKKTSLAAAIIHKPELLVLDEPLEGIDALSANAIKSTLLLMASRGVTVLITSHALDTIEKLCTRIAIVHQGRILLQCPTSGIRTMVRRTLASETYASLEELFVDLVSDKTRTAQLSWM
jgi:ABC-2 type transport system ATP-binding protein